MREYTVEHTPELEEPYQKKIRRQGNSKRKSTAMSHLNEFEIEAARSKNALSKRAYRMQIISVLIVQYPCRHSAILRREYVSG
jgi:hypothetical protein